MCFLTKYYLLTLAKSLAVASPIPDDAPVISATFGGTVPYTNDKCHGGVGDGAVVRVLVVIGGGGGGGGDGDDGGRCGG